LLTYHHGRLLSDHPAAGEEEQEEDSWAATKVGEAKERLRALEEDYRTRDRSASVRYVCIK